MFKTLYKSPWENGYRYVLRLAEKNNNTIMVVIRKRWSRTPQETLASLDSDINERLKSAHAYGKDALKKYAKFKKDRFKIKKFSRQYHKNLSLLSEIEKKLNPNKKPEDSNVGMSLSMAQQKQLSSALSQGFTVSGVGQYFSPKP